MIKNIGKYRIDGILGSGAMGVVYKAYDANIDRVVALKTIRFELFDEHQATDLIARFKNEAQASGRLAHPNIVAVYDYGDGNNITYIAMEFVDGMSLNSLLVPNIPMDLNASISCMTQLLRALAYAHTRGVIHRDIKPANILVTSDAQVKITDFGIAKIESSTLTQVGSVIGSPSYMSPEQFRGETVDGRTDIFSVGIVFYQMLTGVRPFSGYSSAVMHQIMNEMPVNPSRRRPTLNSAFDTVVQKALAKKLEDRYPSALAFLDALLEAHRQQTGDLPPSDEDNERTILAFQKPMRSSDATDFPATQPFQNRGIPVDSSGSSACHSQGSSFSADTLTPWKRELIPELQTALSMQVGPLARLLLKNAIAHAVDVDDLCQKLLPHILSEEGRIQFLGSVTAIKKKSGIFTLGIASGSRSQPSSRIFDQNHTEINNNTQLPFSLATIEEAELRLSHYIGPIAKLIIKRTTKITSNLKEFYRLLSENLASETDKAEFLKLADKEKL